MSYSYNYASTEFATLCRSQIKVLSQGLGAIWSAIYLTQEVTENRDKELLLFAIYPQNNSKLSYQISEIELPQLLQELVSQKKIAPSLHSSDRETQNTLANTQLQQANLATKQLVLPLIHEDVVMGLLITKREDRYWNQEELEQAQAIANTLAIAIFFEKQSQWYQKQLEVQQEINRWQQEQLGNLLHQLRNPLTALRTFGKLLLKRLLPEDRNRSIAQNILREGDRLSGLIDRFAEEVETETTESLPVTLSTTSIRLTETGTRTAQNFLLPVISDRLMILNVEDVLKPLLVGIEAIAENNEITLTVNLPSNLPQVKGDREALREVLNNLLDNAVKYTPQNGRITVETRQNEDLLGIAIEDTGYGIPEADREHLFERHYRGVQATGNIPGTGLGLAIAKQLIEQMQGKIEVISPNPNSFDPDFPGTIFIVWLSIAKN